MDSDFYSESSFSIDDYDSDENEFREMCYFQRHNLQLPECFCSEEEIFMEVLRPATWRSVLNSKHSERLKKFLPQFPVNDEKEKTDTLKKLIDGENFKFGNPLKHFFSKLKDGFLSPGVVKVTKTLKKANYREYKNQQKQYLYNLLQDILISRKKLLDISSTLPPDQSAKMQHIIKKSKDAIIYERAKLRYFSTLQEIRDELGEPETSSEDENYPDYSAPKITKKHKKQMQIYESSISPDIVRVTATTSFLPEHSGSNHFNPNFDIGEVSEERYREMLTTHKERFHPELESAKIDIKDMIVRSNMPKRPTNKSGESNIKKKIKIEPLDRPLHNYSMKNSVDINTIFPLEHNESSYIKRVQPDLDSKSLIFSNTSLSVSSEVQTEPLKIVDESDEFHASINRMQSPQLEITAYPTCFFSLLRDIFCESVEKKLSTAKLEERVRNWQESRTSAVFEWLNVQESWPELVSSALKFLSGDLINILPDTFIPFLNYKEKQQQWQWIGSGRDSDEQMYGLCQQWLENKDDIPLDCENSQGSLPPPRITTVWTVRPTLEEEKRIYREQECIRYRNPHKAFTFKVHGYEAVVGPVKGVYGKESGINKAREHCLLTSDRPPFVTILSLVRDSAARLPNGEGTRADICELLKDSQYLAPASDQQIHTVVSGALDRLHYEKDPCVKYDVNRKLWIYLHRNRTEEEFERIHQAQAAAAKARKAIQKTKLSKSKNILQKNREVIRNPPSLHIISSTDNVSTLLNIDISTALSAESLTQSPKNNATSRILI